MRLQQKPRPAISQTADRAGRQQRPSTSSLPACRREHVNPLARLQARTALQMERANSSVERVICETVLAMLQSEAGRVPLTEGISHPSVFMSVTDEPLHHFGPLIANYVRVAQDRREA
ncbi:hypothetical protein MHYP_G00160770 [Metynnis hypsauchen]